MTPFPVHTSLYPHYKSIYTPKPKHTKYHILFPAYKITR